MLDTIAGSSKLVGDEMGWTMDEFMEFAAKYPDNEVIGAGLTITRKAMLNLLMQIPLPIKKLWKSR